jgi:lambda repressor-like predicted transcriptional regulator
MDLFKFHKNPKDLHGHHEANDIVIDRFWDNVIKLKRASPKQEDVIAKDAVYSFMYARHVLKRRWPKGEDAIAKDTEHSLLYAKYVLKGPFPKGEDAIAKDLNCAYNYAMYCTRKPFSKGEKIISKDPYYKKGYEQRFGIKI